MSRIPIYPTPTYSPYSTPADAARMHRAMDDIFNFGPTGALDFEEQVCRLLISATLGKTLMYLQDQRDVDSYIGFTYAPGWFDENAARTQWWVEKWASERRIQKLQELAQFHFQLQDDFEQHARRIRDSIRMEDERQRQDLVRASVQARATTGQHVSQTATAPTTPNHNPPNIRPTVTAPTASNHNPPMAPQMPAALPSTPAQPAQLTVAPPAASRPILSPGLQIPLAQRPLPPAGFTDQPRARMHPGSYLASHMGTPSRNVQWPEDIEISLVEIATFCPNWFMNPEVVGRAIRNGWSREDIAKAQLLAEDPTSRGKFHTRTDRVQKQISVGGKLLDGQPNAPRFNRDDFRTRLGTQYDLTANAWFFRHAYDPAGHAQEHLGDMPLSAFYAHVQTWPTGSDRLLMTQCLEFARQNPGRQLDSSHWTWIITSQGLASPPPLANGQHRDADALQRLRQLPDPQ